MNVKIVIDEWYPVHTVDACSDYSVVKLRRVTSKMVKRWKEAEDAFRAANTEIRELLEAQDTQDAINKARL